MVSRRSTAILNLPREMNISFSRLKEGLAKLEGVEEVFVNPIWEQVTIEFDSGKIALSDIRTAIHNLASEATVASSE